MGSMRDHLLNGIVSLLISVGITALTAKKDSAPYDERDMLLAVAVSSFLSGFFTSYYAK
jgi:hypothetical protein